ncbi:SDR family oxidoreductase [bacterium]|nr:SDR family oxidoreductase [bacterium]MCP5461605.1 SDR family oxidoreductase [bacterium]
MAHRLSEKVILVIGGTSGIGKALSIGFVKEGATVITTSRSMEKVSATINELKAMGNCWDEPLTTDITSAEQVERTCTHIIGEKKRIDVLACVAGIYIKKPAEDISLEEWHTVINTNLTGTFIANQIVGRAMLSREKGSIINIGSLGSAVALSQTMPYCVSKSGVAMLTQCLSSEWCSRGVRVNALLPGVFPTELNKKALSDPKRVENIIRHTPMRRLGAVEELCGAATFLASDESSFVSGTAIPVDGGFLAFSGF